MLLDQEVFSMSTQSFLKNVNVRSKSKIIKLVDALEKSKKISDAQVKIQKTVTEVKGEQAKEIAKRIKWSL